MLINSILLEAQASAGGNGIFQILMIVALIVIFYFFMIRPQSKKQKEIRKFREALQNGDKIITAGGIYGKIKEVGDTHFIVEISDNVRIKIDKNSVYPSAAEASSQAKSNA